MSNKIDFDFSYDSLLKSLKSIRKKKQITSFQKSQTNSLILRFDVDYSLSNIEELAQLIAPEIESCTFFFLVSSDQYNLGGKLGKQILSALDSLGFEIGLHFDSQLYEKSNLLDASEMLKKEINILEQFASKQINVYSLHNPSTNGFLDLNVEKKSAYNGKYFGPNKYRSDSRMMFPTDLEVSLAKHNADYFQLLLHPEHYGEDRFNYLKSTKRHFDFLHQNLHQAMSINTTFVEQFKPNMNLEKK
jgi:hypothetical protein